MVCGRYKRLKLNEMWKIKSGRWKSLEKCGKNTISIINNRRK
jgi:hypothetical protein